MCKCVDVQTGGFEDLNNDKVNRFDLTENPL